MRCCKHFGSFDFGMSCFGGSMAWHFVGYLAVRHFAMRCLVDNMAHFVAFLIFAASFARLLFGVVYFVFLALVAFFAFLVVGFLFLFHHLDFGLARLC